MELAEVGSAEDCDEVAGPTATVVVVVDPVGAVVGAELEVLELVVVVDAAVVVGAVVVDVVVVLVEVVVVTGGPTQVLPRLNWGSLPRVAAALTSRPIVAVPACRVSSVGL